MQHQTQSLMSKDLNIQKRKGSSGNNKLFDKPQLILTEKTSVNKNVIHLWEVEDLADPLDAGKEVVVADDGEKGEAVDADQDGGNEGPLFELLFREEGRKIVHRTRAHFRLVVLIRPMGEEDRSDSPDLPGGVERLLRPRIGRRSRIRCLVSIWNFREKARYVSELSNCPLYFFMSYR